MQKATPKTAPAADLRRLTVEVVAAYVSRNPLAPKDIAEVVRTVYQTLKGLGEKPVIVAKQAVEPAVSVRRSVTRSHIVCLEDGRKFRALRRHLRASHGMTPEQYRAKWGLGSDYPMVAPGYAAVRSELAKKIGLGRLPTRPAAEAEQPKAARKRRLTQAA
jgi:predicted transcriptional regulator